MQAATGEAVVLDFARSELDEHKRNEPGLGPADDPFRDMTAAPVIDTRELLEQRARMERELAEQSRRLPGVHRPTPTRPAQPRTEEQVPADHAAFRDLAGETIPYAPAVDEEAYTPTVGELAESSRGEGPDMSAGGTDVVPQTGGGEAPISMALGADESVVDVAETWYEEAGEPDNQAPGARVPPNPLAAEPESDAGLQRHHPDPDEVAFPQAVGTATPYAPMEQLPPPLEGHALRAWRRMMPIAGALGIVAVLTIIAYRARRHAAGA